MSGERELVHRIRRVDSVQRAEMPHSDPRGETISLFQSKVIASQPFV